MRARLLDLVPGQCSTGGYPKLGRISKMGQRALRRRLIAGVIVVIRWAARRGTDDPRLAAAALANKMARMVRAVATKKECYRTPAPA